MEVGVLSLRGRKNGDGALYFAQNPDTTFPPNILTSHTTIGHAKRYAPTHVSPGHFGKWAHRVAPLTTISRHEEHRSPHLHDQTDNPQPICRDRARRQQLRVILFLLFSEPSGAPFVCIHHPIAPNGLVWGHEKKLGRFLANMKVSSYLCNHQVNWAQFFRL